MWKDGRAKYRVIERFKNKHPIWKMCELFEVGCRNFAFGIVGKNALSFGAHFLCPDRPRYFRIKDSQSVPVSLANDVADFLCVIRSIIHHRQQYTLNRQLGVILPAHLRNRAKQLLQAFRRKILSLHGNHNAVCRCQRIDREHTQ